MRHSDTDRVLGPWGRARRRILWVQRLLLFTGGGALVFYALGVGAALLLSRSGPRVMPPDGWSWLAFVGLLALLSGLALTAATTRGWWRVLPALALLAGGPFLVLSLVLLQLEARPFSELDRVTLRDGRVIVLGLDHVPTDSVYSLWQAEGRGWRPAVGPAEELTYSEDGSFTADPRLVVTPDGGRLLIRRGGIWTDCLDIGDVLVPCPSLSPGFASPISEQDFLARSARIERLISGAP